MEKKLRKKKIFAHRVTLELTGITEIL